MHLTPIASSWEVAEGDLLGSLTLIPPKASNSDSPGPQAARWERQVTLPSGQRRTVHGSLLAEEDSTGGLLKWLIVERGWNGRRAEGFEPIEFLPSAKYRLLVLARDPLRYGHLPELDCVTFPRLGPGIPETAHYEVSFVPRGSSAPFPGSLLESTSIAVVVWDAYPVEDCPLVAQTGLLEWLHWGGTLIISGPESLDTLDTSFLAPYLPATSGGSRELDTLALGEIEQALEISPLPSLGQPLAWSGAQLVLCSTATIRVGDAGNPLVVEGRVGRGRIVVTSFALGQREWLEWPAHDSLWHTILLGRRPRSWPRSWPRGLPGRPREDTEVRWRDRLDDPSGWVTDVRLLTHVAEIPNFDRELSGPSVAAWSDSTELAQEASRWLVNHSGWIITGRWMVAGWLAVYLAVIGPLNWLVFRIFRRVEWGWWSVVAVSLTASVLMIRAAPSNLDWSRRWNELTFIERWGDFPRVHVTRFASLTNTLGDRYSITSDEPAGWIFPFEQPDLFASRGTRSPVTIDETPTSGSVRRLRDLIIPSSSAQLLHAEQMADVPCLWQVEMIDARLAKVTYRGNTLCTGGLWTQGLWIPFQLKDPGTSFVLDLEDGLKLDEVADLEPLGMELVLLLTSFPGDEPRLIVWNERIVPGITIAPASDHHRGWTIEVIHLASPSLAPIIPERQLPPRYRPAP